MIRFRGLGRWRRTRGRGVLPATGRVVRGEHGPELRVPGGIVRFTGTVSADDVEQVRVRFEDVLRSRIDRARACADTGHGPWYEVTTLDSDVIEELCSACGAARTTERRGP